MDGTPHRQVGRCGMESPPPRHQAGRGHVHGREVRRVRAGGVNASGGCRQLRRAADNWRGRSKGRRVLSAWRATSLHIPHRACAQFSPLDCDAVSDSPSATTSFPEQRTTLIAHISPVEPVAILPPQSRRSRASGAARLPITPLSNIDIDCLPISLLRLPPAQRRLLNPPHGDRTLAT